MEIRTIVRCHFIPIRAAKIKKKKSKCYCVDESVEKM